MNGKKAPADIGSALDLEELKSLYKQALKHGCPPDFAEFIVESEAVAMLVAEAEGIEDVAERVRREVK